MKSDGTCPPTHRNVCFLSDPEQYLFLQVKTLNETFDPYDFPIIWLEPVLHNIHHAPHSKQMEKRKKHSCIRFIAGSSESTNSDKASSEPKMILK